MASPSLWARLRGQSPVAKKVAMNLLGFATCIPVIAFLNMQVAELTVVNGASMYPFLNEDKDSTLTRDLLLTYKWSHRTICREAWLLRYGMYCQLT